MRALSLIVLLSISIPAYCEDDNWAKARSMTKSEALNHDRSQEEAKRGAPGPAGLSIDINFNPLDANQYCDSVVQVAFGMTHTDQDVKPINLDDGTNRLFLSAPSMRKALLAIREGHPTTKGARIDVYCKTEGGGGWVLSHVLSIPFENWFSSEKPNPFRIMENFDEGSAIARQVSREGKVSYHYSGSPGEAWNPEGARSAFYNFINNVTSLAVLMKTSRAPGTYKNEILDNLEMAQQTLHEFDPERPEVMGMLAEMIRVYPKYDFDAKHDTTYISNRILEDIKKIR